MILIPIGHEQESTRRMPWITLGVIVACAIAFLLTGFGGSRSEWAALEAHERAVTYWLDHPYLRIDPDVERTMHGLATGEVRESFREGLRSSTERPDAATLAEEQLELDRLCDLALNAPPDHPFFRWGLVPADLSAVALISHMFLHAGWLHLLGNLFILYLTGPFVEDVWGRGVFGAFYLASGIVAALAFALPHADLREPMIGASGAIAGVMGAFAVRYFSTRIRFFYMIGLGAVRGTFDAPAWFMLGLWFAQQVLLSIVTSGGTSGAGGGVAYLAHAGGFAFGAAVAFAFKRYRIEERHLAPGLEAASARLLVEHRAVDEALALAERGEVDGAVGLLEDELRRTPSHHEAALALWSIAGEGTRARQAAPHFARLIQDELRRGETASAVEHWQELRHAVPTATLDGRSMLKLAGILAGGHDRRLAADALRRALLGLGRAPDASLALKLAELAVEIEPPVARAAVQVALGRRDLEPEARRRAERMLERLAMA